MPPNDPLSTPAGLAGWSRHASDFRTVWVDGGHGPADDRPELIAHLVLEGAGPE